jgi:hypothetical protein
MVCRQFKENKTTLDRLEYVTLQINQFMHKHSLVVPETIVIEIPDYHYEDTNKKSMELLNKTIGFIEGKYSEWWEIIEVPVRTWKGNRPKEETRIIVEHDYPQVKTSTIAASTIHNAIDAIGLGDWYIKNYELERRCK